MRYLASLPVVLVLTVGCAGGDGPTAPISAPPSTVPSAVASASLAPTSPTALPTAAPSFTRAETDKRSRADKAMTVVFEETGLANGAVVSYVLVGDVSASYQCWNPTTGAIRPARDGEVMRRVEAHGTLTADSEGTIASTLRLVLPRPDAGICKEGFQPSAWRGSYQEIMLTDSTNHISIDIAGREFIA